MDVVEVWDIVEEHLPTLRLAVIALKTEIESTSAKSQEPPEEPGGSSVRLDGGIPRDAVESGSAPNAPTGKDDLASS